MKKHPSHSELLAYAESLVDTGATISATIGSHLTDCTQCAAHVEAMRANLEYIAQAAPLEPSKELTAGILLAARNARRAAPERTFSRFIPLRLVRATAYAAAILVLSTIAMGAAVYTSSDTGVRISTLNVVEPEVSLESIEKTAAKVELLAEAVPYQSKKPATLTELEHRRSVRALNADIEAAKAALERNPGCARAGRIFDKSLQRKAQALKAVYVESSF